jgi:hypothetical protein
MPCISLSSVISAKHWLSEECAACDSRILVEPSKNRHRLGESASLVHSSRSRHVLRGLNAVPLDTDKHYQLKGTESLTATICMYRGNKTGKYVQTQQTSYHQKRTKPILSAEGTESLNASSSHRILINFYGNTPLFMRETNRENKFRLMIYTPNKFDFRFPDAGHVIKN